MSIHLKQYYSIMKPIHTKTKGTFLALNWFLVLHQVQGSQYNHLLWVFFYQIFLLPTDMSILAQLSKAYTCRVFWFQSHANAHFGCHDMITAFLRRTGARFLGM